jgi:hypothetical protein
LGWGEEGGEGAAEMGSGQSHGYPAVV